jgi:ABC-type lipoprotein release transport system permease subunit
MWAIVWRLRSEFRSRRLSWLLLVAIVALVAGVASAAAAGARRTDTAYDRFVADRHTADVLLDNVPNPQIPISNLNPVTRLPQVAEFATFKYFAISDSSANAYAAPNDRAYSTAGLNRLKILHGRMSNAARADEAVVDFVLAKQRHLHIGDTYRTVFSRIPATSTGNLVVDSEHATPAPLSFKIVGIAAAPGQFPPQDSRGYLADPPVYLTPAFYRAYSQKFIALDAVLARLRPGQEPAFERAVQNLHGVGALPLEQFNIQAAIVKRSFHLQAVALWLAAAALALLGALIVAQLISRQSTLAATDYPTMRSLGMTPRQLRSIGVLRAAALGVAGACLAVIPAVLLSNFTPIGTARQAEPHPGVSGNWTLIAIEIAATFLVVVLVSLWPSWRDARLARESSDAHVRASVVAEGLARAGAPVTMTTGVRMAFQRGRGRTAVPVRTSLASAALGIWAVVAALTFGANLTHLLDHPHQYGVTWDAEVLNGEGPAAVQAAVGIAHHDPNVANVAMLGGAPAELRGHEADAQVLIPRVGTITPPVLDGHLPDHDNQIAVGTRTLNDLGLHVGSTTSLRVWDPNATSHRVTVVGRVVLTPGSRSFGAAADMGEGIVTTPHALHAYAPHGFTIPDPYIVAVQFHPGVTPTTGRNELEHRLGGVRKQWFVQQPVTPETLIDFGHVRDLPLLLGGVLAAIAAIAITHLLVSSIRRQRPELAILKTLGFVPRQIRHAVAWQASTLAVVALVIGVPLGVITGRLIWSFFADRLGVVAQVVTPTVAIFVLALATLAIANVIALVPARIAARTRAASILRTN